MQTTYQKRAIAEAKAGHSIAEPQLRRRLSRLGFRLEKSKVRRRHHAGNLGKYQVIRIANNEVVLGSEYDAGLHDVEVFLTREAARA